MSFDPKGKVANRYGVDLYFYKYGDAELTTPLAVIDFANEVAYELTSDVVWATGGRGFKKMVGFKNPYDGTLTITTQITNNVLLDLLTGGDGTGAAEGEVKFTDEDKNNNYFIIKGYTVFKAEDGTIVYEEITACKAMVNSSFSASYTGDGDPQSIEIEFQLAANDDGDVLIVKRGETDTKPADGAGVGG